MKRVKHKTDDYIFKYSIMLRIILATSIALVLGFIAFFLVWIIVEATIQPEKGIYVLIGVISATAFGYGVLLIWFLLIGIKGRKNVAVNELVEIILLTKNSKSTVLYLRLLRCMHPFRYKKKITQNANITFTEE
ncbi:hypothetical protein [Mycoplasma seminis]|uniref:Uncharacterized protein n=1 Tax=Mycoplasma seminis TaxID=512749 RepID=A0ABY9H9Q8_9MOLU|nr:hypothetical protein [Mycoplasma seminis]WLP85328.1 hypothetical protein Q8852_03325 [Mycoplasma seminis]